MKKKILLAFDNPGGGHAVCSLLTELGKIKEAELVIYSGRLSEKFTGEFHFRKINTMITDIEAEEIINSNLPDMLITATGGGNAEQLLRNTAFEKNIKSVVILDFWKDYTRRWKYSTYGLNEMKDIVCVMDELTKKEMAAEGFPEEKIIATGHPYLDLLFDSNKNGKELIPAGSENDKVKLLFLSQPPGIIGVNKYREHPLKTLLESVEEISGRNKTVYSIVIKPHPLETELSELIKTSEDFNFNKEKIEIRIADKSEDTTDLILSSDIIIGYNTIAMFESRSFNKRTISLSLVPVRESLTAAMKDAGIEIIPVNKEQITECLNSIPVRKNPDGVFKGGISNCIKVILKELNLN